MSLFDLSILDMLPQVVADGAKGGVHFSAEVAPKSYWGFIYRAFLLQKKNDKKNLFKLFDILLKCI